MIVERVIGPLGKQLMTIGKIEAIVLCGAYISPQ